MLTSFGSFGGQKVRVFNSWAPSYPIDKPVILREFVGDVFTGRVFSVQSGIEVILTGKVAILKPDHVVKGEHDQLDINVEILLEEQKIDSSRSVIVPAGTYYISTRSAHICWLPDKK